MNRKQSIINIVIYFAGMIFTAKVLKLMFNLSDKFIQGYSFFAIVMSLIGLVLFVYNRKYLKRQFGKNLMAKQTYTELIKGFILLFGLLILNLIFFYQIDPSVGQTPANEAELNEMFANVPKLSLVLVAGIIIPLIEELIFRVSLIGVMIGNKQSTSYVPYILAAVVFALFHDTSILENPQNVESIYFFMMYFIPALVLTLYYKKTNHNLLVVYFIHMVNNILGVI